MATTMFALLYLAELEVGLLLSTFLGMALYSKR